MDFQRKQERHNALKYLSVCVTKYFQILYKVNPITWPYLLHHVGTSIISDTK